MITCSECETEFDSEETGGVCPECGNDMSDEDDED